MGEDSRTKLKVTPAAIGDAKAAESATSTAR
jgi:hypothetical protein